MDFKHFKKVKEDENTVTLQHPEGHQINIAKKALKGKMKSDLAALPMHFDDGGVVPDISVGPNAPAPQGSPDIDPELLKAYNIEAAKKYENPNDPTAALPYYYDTATNTPPQNIDPDVYNKANNDVQQSKQEAEQSAKEMAAKSAQMTTEQNQARAGLGAPLLPQTQAPQTAPAQQAQVQQTGLQSGLGMQNTDPYGMQAYANTFGAGMGQYESGIAGEAVQQGKLGEAETQTLEKYQNKLEQNSSNYNENLNNLQNETAGLMQDIKNNQIDPNRLFHNMSTMDKISSSIGLILGGIGGGITGQENPALKLMNNFIDRDIESQKANLGAKENLLNANLRMYGNMRDAADMTKVQLTEMMKNELQEKAATAQGPIAQQRALQAIGQLNMQNAQTIGMISMRKTLLGGMENGQVRPEAVVKMLVPPSDQPKAMDSLKVYEDLNRMRVNTLSDFDTMAKQVPLSNRLISPLQSGSIIDSINSRIATLSKDTAGRFTEQDAQALAATFPNWKDDKNNLVQKRQRLNNLIMEKMDFPSLRFYGIDVTKAGSRMNAQGQKTRQLAPPTVQPQQ